MPSTPPIPVGLASVLGIVFALLTEVGAALILALEGIPDDASSAVIVGTLIVSGAAAALRVIDGRMNQASTAIAVAPIADDEDPEFEEDVDDLVREEPPSERDLVDLYADEPPSQNPLDR